MLEEPSNRASIVIGQKIEEHTEPIICKLNNTTHYASGRYIHKSPEDTWELGGSVFEFRDIVSVQLNQLKAKLFNLIESASTDKTQQEALKGLVKGFSNEAYRNINGDLEGWLENMGFKVVKELEGKVPESNL